MTTKFDIARRVVAVYEIAAGALAANSLLYGLFDENTPFWRFDILTVRLIMLALVVASIVGGALLWRVPRDRRERKALRVGRRLSLVVQAVQIPHLVLPTFIYSLWLAFALPLGERPIEPTPWPTTHFALSFGANEMPLEVTVNIVPLIALIVVGVQRVTSGRHARRAPLRETSVASPG
ncbi:MAG: hypothetical protein WKG32_06335 [Gemmatimonadaceae bacterium]